MKRRLLGMGALMCLGLAGCSQQVASTPTTVAPTEVVTEAPTESTTEVETTIATESNMPETPAVETSVEKDGDISVSSDRCFDESDSDPVLKLFKEYMAANEGKNFVFSPYSIRDALSLLAPAADEVALKEFKDVLGVTEDRTCFEVLDTLAKDKEGFDVANKAYLSDTLYEGEINTEYLDVDDFQTINMAGDGADIINSWVSDVTKDKINNLVSKDAITDSALVLVNALYFNQKFKETYEESSLSWNNGDGYVSFVGSAESADVLEPNEDIDILRLKYADTDYSLYIICDNNNSQEKGVVNFIKGLSAEEFDALFKEGEKEFDKVTFAVPNFEIDSKDSVANMLGNLGMQAAFDSQNSHFSKLGNVYVSDVIHGAYIKTDKTGTEAAGATAITMDRCSAAIDEVTKHVVADSDFMFVVRDNKMNTTLFAGMVCEPTTPVE